MLACSTICMPGAHVYIHTCLVFGSMATNPICPEWPRAVSGFLVEIIISGHQLLFDPVSGEFGKVFFFSKLFIPVDGRNSELLRDITMQSILPQKAKSSICCLYLHIFFHKIIRQH